MWIESLKIGDLKVKVPVIQGGMGIGISLGGLAGAVAEAGGVGMISAAQIGFREPDFDTDTKRANLRAIKKEYEKARKAAPDGVIGFNIMVAMRHYEDYVQAAVKAGADIIVSGAGVPAELPAITGEAPVKLAPIVSTQKSTKVLLKYWDKKYKRMPDLLIVEGPMAGGHLGFGKEELDTFLDTRIYDEEIQKILQIVREYEQIYGRKIPVALAGGMDDREQVRHAFTLGADAVQVATRFVTTKECDADLRYKQAYLDARKEDIVIVKSPVGMPGRAIKNALTERVMKGEKIPHSFCHGCLHKCNPAEIPYCITDALIHAAKGEIDEGLLFCGANAYKSGKLQTVKEVMEDLMRLDK